MFNYVEGVWDLIHMNRDCFNGKAAEKLVQKDASQE